MSKAVDGANSSFGWATVMGASWPKTDTLTVEHQGPLRAKSSLFSFPRPNGSLISRTGLGRIFAKVREGSTPLRRREPKSQLRDATRRVDDPSELGAEALAAKRATLLRVSPVVARRAARSQITVVIRSAIFAGNDVVDRVRPNPATEECDLAPVTIPSQHARAYSLPRGAVVKRVRATLRSQ